jgi:hypothetical protein
MSDWYQQSLLTVEVVEARIRLGIIPERSHAQVMVEVLDPTTGILIAQWSRPSGDAATWYDLLDEAVQKTHERLGDLIDPF